MENNLSLVDNITYGARAETMLARVEKNANYELTFTSKGDMQLKFWIIDETTNRHLLVINRMSDITAGNYKYKFIAPDNGVIVYTASGSAINISNVNLRRV